MTVSILERIYASAPTDVFAIHTLEISSAAFVGPFRFVQDFNDYSAKLETGELVTFQASGIGLQLPQRGVKGREDLVFQLDNVSGEATTAIKKVLASGDEATVTYRIYASNDNTGPLVEPVVLVATAAKVNVRSVQIVATFRDFVNRRWPHRYYDLKNFPQLKYVT